MEAPITELYFRIMYLAAGGWALYELICLVLCLKNRNGSDSEDKEL